MPSTLSPAERFLRRLARVAAASAAPATPSLPPPVLDEWLHAYARERHRTREWWRCSRAAGGVAVLVASLVLAWLPSAAPGVPEDFDALAAPDEFFAP